jgi:hypothetical protein
VSENILNLNRVFMQADAMEMSEGMSAYQRYHDSMEEFANYYGNTIEGTVGAFVALSPNNSYAQNLRSLASVLKGVNEGVPVENIITSTFPKCRARAFACASGKMNFLQEAKGQKTRAFYQNIVDPTDNHPVTVDGHMYGAWKGEYTKMTDAKVSQRLYGVISGDIREIAFYHHLLPHQVQAILWFTWKRLHRVLFSEQLNLFTVDDHWQSRSHPAFVKPFTKKETV